ncbi:cysteine proteinase [Auriculariales sp. MPI-PUGE-AT-0066]|nr:cysteine proteinase [Auriculariales sp. MPI-PUGE-AT-0066]
MTATTPTSPPTTSAPKSVQPPAAGSSESAPRAGPVPKGVPLVDHSANKQRDTDGQGLGSKNTSVVFHPAPTIPTRDDADKENERVAMDMDVDSDMPDLVEADEQRSGWDYKPVYVPQPNWEAQTGQAPGCTQNDLTSWGNSNDTHFDWSNMYSVAPEPLVHDWWDPNQRAIHQRPGPGLLPLAAFDALHDSDHTLLRTTVKTPLDEHVLEGKIGSASAGFSNDLVIPSKDELARAKPHPDALYCRPENSWVIQQVRLNRATIPPLPNLPPGTLLPDNDTRQRAIVCKGPETHHYHEYRGAGNASSFDPPYQPAEWQARHSDAVTALICCRCPATALVTTEPIPGIISGPLLEKLAKERADLPVIGKTGPDMVIWAFQSICMIIENVLWRGNSQSIRSCSSWYTQRIGWSDTTLGIWQAMGFAVEEAERTEQLPSHFLIGPPSSDIPKARARLLRAWVEIQAWTADFRRRTHPNKFAVFNPLSAAQSRKPEPWMLFVEVEVDTPFTQRVMGCGPEEMKREPAPTHAPRDLLKSLGLTTSTWDPDLIKHAYKMQIHCDPSHTPHHFTRLYRLNLASTNALEELIVTERSLSRWTVDELHDAALKLGYGEDNDIGVDLSGIAEFWKQPAGVMHVGADEEAKAEDTHILEAFKHARTKGREEETFALSGHGGTGAPALTITGPGQVFADALGLHTASAAAAQPLSAQQKRAKEVHLSPKEALRIVGEFRGSKLLVEMSSAKDPMDLQQAYQIIGASTEMDEDTLIAVHSMRVEEAPAQLEMLNEAIQVIAESRNSQRLQQFVRTGADPGDLSLIRPPEWPRGLNQLGNTCYLNSLLQYFYTIKDLREAVSVLPDNVLEVDKEWEKVTDDDLKKHRVGGRLVTRREVARSRKFVSQLGGLFTDMRLRNDPAVTPSLELAKLALVTSKDEEEDDARERPGTTNSSASTDKTLVDDVALPAATPLPAPSASEGDLSKTIAPSSSGSSSVLGKRLRRSHSAMDLDSQSASPDTTDDGFIVVSPTESTSASKPKRPVSVSGRPASQPMDTTEELTVPVAAGADKEKGKMAPPPLPPRKKSTIEDSGMMFGRQHDVSECMDNCMFQIETAFLRFDGSDDIQKASVVKRLFYGKLRQRISAVDGSGKPNEKEDLYMSLPVNVVDEETTDLYDGLAGYFDDIVDFEGKKSRMEVTLVDLPPVLHVQLQRVQFNRETLQPYKCHAYVKFGETLHMDRFLDGAPANLRDRSKAIHSELVACRERLRSLTQGKFAPYTDTLKHTLEFLRSKNVGDAVEAELDDSLVELLTAEQSSLEGELVQLKLRIVELQRERETLWAGNASPSAEYELTSVFVHRGSGPTFGHYFFYARNLPEKPNEWFKYNDSEVSAASRDDVLRDSTGDTLNAYMLVYARKGADIMHTIHREVPRVEEMNVLE